MMKICFCTDEKNKFAIAKNLKIPINKSTKNWSHMKKNLTTKFIQLLRTKTIKNRIKNKYSEKNHEKKRKQKSYLNVVASEVKKREKFS